MQKCYPSTFEQNVINYLKNDSEKALCKAVLSNDENEIQYLCKVLLG